jgi:hypothetical protein
MHTHVGSLLIGGTARRRRGVCVKVDNDIPHSTCKNAAIAAHFKVLVDAVFNTCCAERVENNSTKHGRPPAAFGAKANVVCAGLCNLLNATSA